MKSSTAPSQPFQSQILIPPRRKRSAAVDSRCRQLGGQVLGGQVLGGALGLVSGGPASAYTFGRAGANAGGQTAGKGHDAVAPTGPQPLGTVPLPGNGSA